MKVYYNKYFLSDSYFNTKAIKEKYDCESISSIKDTFFSKLMNIHLKKINLLFKFFVFFMPSTYFRKNNSVLFLFGITNLFDVFSAVQKTQSKHICVWLWNPLRMTFSKRILFLYFRLLKARVITFDKQDAEKYNLIFHPQIFNPEIINSSLAKEIKYDLFYIGADKCRYAAINEIAEKLEKLSLTFNFNVVKDKTTKNPQAKYISLAYIDYNAYLTLLNQSACLLDYTQEKQSGLTVRVVEAIFTKKKIITNNHDIIHYDIYDPNNIFILGVDSELHLIDFLRSPFHDYPNKLLNKHSLVSLLELAKQPEANSFC